MEFETEIPKQFKKILDILRNELISAKWYGNIYLNYYVQNSIAL
jgi:hypothetical protein